MFDFNDNVDAVTARRREVVFMVFSGLFLGSLTMLNILGISRFIDLSFNLFGLEVPFKFGIGVLAYPITFLCTDFISEIYGKKRANMLVWIGLMLNVWVIFILWIGGILPGAHEGDQAVSDDAFMRIRALTFGAVTASMIAYMAAQFVDVHLFHFLKKVTKGKHLWIRNNFSTLTSQLVDSSAVILITHFYTKAIPIDNSEPIASQLLIFIVSTYVFKLVAALADTIPFYIGTKFLSRYLKVDPNKEFNLEKE